MIIKGYLFTYLYIFLIIGLSTLFYKKGSGTLTRKIIHIGVSFCYVIFINYFKNSIHILIPPFTFIILNYISYKKDLFKAMEGKKSLGTVYYSISVFIMCLITYFNESFYPYFGIGLFIMAFGDGFAEIIGHLSNKRIYKNKTLLGSLTLFIISIIVLIIFNNIFSLNYGIITILIIALVSALIECISNKGLDNLTLPLVSSLISYLLGVI